MEPTPWAGSRRPAGARAAAISGSRAARLIASVSQSTSDVYLFGVSMTILTPLRGTAEKSEAFTHIAMLLR